MTTYRVGNHQPQNIYRDDAYIGVMFTAEDAALVVEALNGGDALKLLKYALHLRMHGENAPGGNETWAQFDCDAETLLRQVAVLYAADSCTCPPASGPRTMPDPLCVVHRGRRARGPKPPPLGPGCACDYSGRTCPRHGAVS